VKIRLLFFAVLRDITGSGERQMDVADGTRPADIWATLRAEYPQLASYTTPPLAAINEEYAGHDTLLRDGDELAFIPPVAGG
jgi:molybdopterin synthase sulfur carrier subunit